MNPTQAAASGMPSFWELVVSGGPLMWPLGACSVIALMYFVERCLCLRKARRGVVPEDARCAPDSRKSFGSPRPKTRDDRRGKFPDARLLFLHPPRRVILAHALDHRIRVLAASYRLPPAQIRNRPGPDS